MTLPGIVCLERYQKYALLPDALVHLGCALQPLHPIFAGTFDHSLYGVSWRQLMSADCHLTMHHCHDFRAKQPFPAAATPHEVR